jgi:hypothetical protein
VCVCVCVCVEAKQKERALVGARRRQSRGDVQGRGVVRAIQRTGSNAEVNKILGPRRCGPAYTHRAHTRVRALDSRVWVSRSRGSRRANITAPCIAASRVRPESSSLHFLSLSLVASILSLPLCCLSRRYSAARNLPCAPYANGERRACKARK